MKVSFEYENLLEHADIQGFARTLKTQGVEVIIVTQKSYYSDRSGIDSVCETLNINHVRFCGASKKWENLHEVFAHYDPDPKVVKAIKKNTSCLAFQLTSEDVRISDK